jgi:hypothetical protein
MSRLRGYQTTIILMQLLSPSPRVMKAPHESAGRVTGWFGLHAMALRGKAGGEVYSPQVEHLNPGPTNVIGCFGRTVGQQTARISLIIVGRDID